MAKTNVKKGDIRASRPDMLLWGVVGILLVGGLLANYYYGEVAVALRATGWLILALVIVALAYQTSQGRRVWAFSLEARNEIRKVFWPTRQQTIQSTAIVAALCVFTALVLWGVDSLVLWIVGILAGQRG